MSKAENLSDYDQIIKTLKEKAAMKQDVYENTLRAFNTMKTVGFDLVREIRSNPQLNDKRVVVDYRERGDFEFELRISGELLIFSMHTNIFEFDKDHLMWRSSYIKEAPFRSFCGLINVYNFLNDSFKYKRINDLGYLIGRIFINKDSHYFLEGKRQLGFLHNDFSNDIINEKAIRAILESLVLYSLNFDLYTPPYDSIKEISVSEMEAVNESMQIKTGKRLGFRFQADDEEV
jgi:hypothetical protein